MKQRLLTAAMGDALLNFLVENVEPDEFISGVHVEEILQATDLKINELSAFLSEFQRNGLIEHFSLRSMYVDFLVRRELHKFVELGGFGGEIAALKVELDNLKGQLESMNDEQTHKTVSTIANVLSIIGSLSKAFLDKY